MPDSVQIRLYIGDKYLEIRVPNAGDAPVIRGELISPHDNAVEGRVLSGGHVADLTWVEGDSGPKVVEVVPGTIQKGSLSK